MMEFRSLTNIETSFKQIRLYAAAFVVLCIVITGIVVYSSYAFANRQREKIYVLDNGKSLILALSQDAAANRPVEAREHVRRFHELFFTVAPDKDAIEKNMERAPSSSATKRHTITTATSPRRATSIASFPVTSTSAWRWTRSAATSIATRMR